MSITSELLNQIVTTARNLEAQFYFERARSGDQRAASLFAKLVAYTSNPEGDPSGAGWLSKSPGESQVEGYAEDAIVIGNDPDDLENVIDLVNGAGAPGASIGGAVKPRRPTNRWVKPQPLTASQLQYLRPGGAPIPQPPQARILPKGEAFDALKALDAFYRAPEGLQRPEGIGGDMEAIAQWFFQLVIEGRTMDDVKAQIRQSDEWKGKHP